MCSGFQLVSQDPKVGHGTIFRGSWSFAKKKKKKLEPTELQIIFIKS